MSKLRARKPAHTTNLRQKNLGAFLDNTLSMEQHIHHFCRSAYFAMRQIASMRRYLTEKKTLSSCSVHLCYPCRSSCHSCFTPPENTKQCNQTCPPKIKTKRVTPLLKQPHWLPIQTCIDYKLRHFDGSLPQYLSSRLDIYQPSRSLRSSHDRLLRVPNCKLKSFGYRSFIYQGPVVWNSIPTHFKFSSSLASFKSKLKTRLFKN